MKVRWYVASIRESERLDVTEEWPDERPLPRAGEFVSHGGEHPFAERVSGVTHLVEPGKGPEYVAVVTFVKT
jgi:hypothetical protein